ncbi:phytanoyl-CoA dioxygenase family protein [Nitrosopumilus sp. K4]|uniref:phytanoyl-CoA dioxygenase family protein n=1 Tax=Nitrosopumilus sp. K4 TaxID=2795383 RepID=UPI001BA79E73|nr:phytanoyl-CoA dioxygenase family protein [Nitrosopumilus sp. K4]QUC64456.1 phytanoyl-CoA dioxygenase family protein [Nitrosopumilus sp. K4]
MKKISDEGFTVIENVLSQEECKKISDRLDVINAEEQEEFGKERLEKVNEIGILRSLLLKDKIFSELIIHPKVYPIICATVGETAILHLQNAIIVFPDKKHGQSHFHRDFAKDFVSSKPLSINALWMIDEFNAETGATWVVPGTHKMENWPSNEFLEQNAIQASGSKGSVLVFDSMLIHRGGSNSSSGIRRAINHQYTKPFIKQQLDFPKYLGKKYDIESKIGQVLGYWTIPPKSVSEFRCEPEKRTYRSGQG